MSLLRTNHLFLGLDPGLREFLFTLFHPKMFSLDFLTPQEQKHPPPRTGKDFVALRSDPQGRRPIQRTRTRTSRTRTHPSVVGDLSRAVLQYIRERRWRKRTPGSGFRSPDVSSWSSVGWGELPSTMMSGMCSTSSNYFYFYV